ncbi:MAG: ribosome recycling factor [Pseudomonadota bacterium]
MADGIDLNDIKKRMEGAIASMTKDLGGLRTGRASASILDPVMVDAYGQKMPLNQVANVNAPDAKLITVQIWDKSMVGPVDKAVREAGLGLNPVVDGQNLRIPLPDLNEERRRELVKVAKDYAENAKVAIRHVRRDGMEVLKKAEKDKEIGQDEARATSDKVQKLTDEKVAEVEKVLAQKESEIMQV